MSYPLLLHGTHARTTVTYQAVGEWMVPWRIGSFDQEYDALRHGAGLIDYSHQALIEVAGSDRVDFLQRLLTNDIARLAPGGGCHAALLTPSGKLVAEMLVLIDPETISLMLEATRAQTVAQLLDRYLFTEQVRIVNHERREAVLALQGPRALERLAHLCDQAISLPHPGDHLRITLHGVPVRVVSHRLIGEVGLLCCVAAEEAQHIWEYVKDQGQRLGITLVGWEALNTARIEAGIPWDGVDLEALTLLPETGLESAIVSSTKGCYVGQEVIARIATYGAVSRRLVGLLLERGQMPQSGDRLVREQEEVGVVTSACHSPLLQHPIAMGYVKRGANEPGTRLAIRRGEQRLPATVTTRPFTPLASTA